jgi:microcystin-dependent protein
MQSIAYVNGSNGAANASLMTVQTVRAPGATTITTNTIAGAPTFFYASMGAPHTFTDPVTGESITVISEATAVDFAGTINAGKIDIVAIAPGYVDTRGSLVGDIVVIRPTTEWANNLKNILAADHNNDGTHMPNTINPVGTMVDYAGVTAPTGWLLAYGQAVSRSTYATLFGVLNPNIGTVTISIASPGVVTFTNHNLQTGDSIYFTSTGALPTGLTANTQYFAIRVDANNFRIATSYANAIAGTAINTSGTQSGVHTLRQSPYGIGDGSTTFNVPDARGRVIAGNDNMGGTSADRLTDPTGVTVNGINGDVLGKTGGDQLHQLTLAQSPSHSHSWLSGNATAAAGGTGGVALNNAGYNNYAPTDGRGSDQAHNNVQPTLILNKIIKT